MDISDYIALTAALIAIAALFWQIRTSNQQSKMQTFLVYTQRYQDILLNLPSGIEASDFDMADGVEDKEVFLRYLRAYFDLCSEQFYLHEKGFIDDKVWALWQGGMRDSLKKPAFKQAWVEIQSHDYYHNKFAEYIEGLINA